MTATLFIVLAPISHSRQLEMCVTGVVHFGAPAETIAQLGPEAMGAYTECAHIIPEATFFGVNPKIEENSTVGFHFVVPRDR